MKIERCDSAYPETLKHKVNEVIDRVNAGVPVFKQPTDPDEIERLTIERDELKRLVAKQQDEIAELRDHARNMEVDQGEKYEIMRDAWKAMGAYGDIAGIGLPEKIATLRKYWDDTRFAKPSPFSVRPAVVKQVTWEPGKTNSLLLDDNLFPYTPMDVDYVNSSVIIRIPCKKFEVV